MTQTTRSARLATALTGFAASCAISAIAVPAAAQTGSAPAPAAAAPVTPLPAQEATAALVQDDTEKKDIVVTAQRREQALSDVGISVTTLSAEDLVSKNITSTSDLARTIPSFTAANSSLNTPVYSIRGIGLNESSLAANSTIAISVDEVPLPYAAMTQGAVLDLSRVEVLKGPQGTLYGLNSTGGAINYIAGKPGNTPEANVRASFGRFNTFNGEGVVSVPLSDTLGTRLAVSTVQSGDWQKSYTRNDELGATHKAAGRLTFAWNPSSRINVDLILSGWVDRSDTPASQAIAFRIQSRANIGLISQVLAQPLLPAADARLANWTPGLDLSRHDHMLQGALKVGIDLNSTLSLASTTSYAYFKQDALVDRDGLPSVSYHARVFGSIKSFYQELRLISNASDFHWSLGGNYRRDTVDDDQTTFTGESTIGVAAGRPIPLNGIDTLQKVSTYAFFADGEYNFTRKLSLVAGVRYTRDKRDFRGSTIDTGDGLSAAAFTIAMNGQRARFGLPPLPAIQPGGSVTLAAGTFAPGYVVDSLDEDNLSYHVGVNFKPAARSLLYASISRGYKAGSFPTLGAIFAVGFQAAKQERVDAYEVGFKTSLLDNLVQLNGAGFYYDYKDKQLRGRIIDPLLGSLSKLVNIPRSQVYGAELEMTVRPTRGLSLNGSLSYIDTEILEFTNVNLFGVLENFRGSRLNYTPKWYVNLSGQYSVPLSERLNVVAGADFIYRSSTSGFLGNDPDLAIKAYSTLDLRLGIESANKKWSATVYGYNVTNEYYWTSVNRGTDTIFRYAAMPVTYGLRVAWRY